MTPFGPETIALLMAVAFLAGAIDAISGGGGLLTIPALLSAGLSPVAAIATNKLQSTFSVSSAVIAFARRGQIDFRRFAWPAVGSFIGSGIGALILTRVDSHLLSGLIPLLLIAMAAYFTFAPRMTDEDRHVRAGPRLMLFAAGLIGAYDGFFGPGAASFFITVLVAIFGLGLRSAVAQTKLLNLASNLAALAVLMAGGHVLWVVGLAMAVGSSLGAQVGAHLAIRFGANAVRPLLIVMSLGLTTKLLSDPANPLTAMVLRWLG